MDQLALQGKSLPDHVHREFEAYLKCGRLEHGFLRVRCDNCHFARLVAFSCKKRGFCPSYGARRMAETGARLVDEVFPDVPLRQWVISFPFPLRYLFAAHPQAMGKVLGIDYRAISTHLIHNTGISLKDCATGAVTLIQRFGSALSVYFPPCGCGSPSFTELRRAVMLCCRQILALQRVLLKQLARFPAELAANLQSRQRVTLLDVRDPGEWAQRIDPSIACY